MPNGIQMEPTRWSQLHFPTDNHPTEHISHMGIVVIELRHYQVYYDNNRLLKYASQWKSLYKDVHLTPPRAASVTCDKPSAASN
jgi:predicted SprT family Zn-dependent metalloprotease